jgi:hypothetical protein
MRKPILCAVLLLVCASSARAQQERGDIELQFAGSFSSEVGGDDEASTVGMFQMKGGYYLSDRLEVGGYPSLLVRSTRRESGGRSERETDATVGLGVFVVYSFLSADATTVPYAGAQVYRSDLGDPDSPDWFGVNGGVKVFLNRTTAFDVGGNFMLRFDGGSSQLLLFQVGLSFLL